MVRPLTTAQARRHWAKVLRTARRGTPVVVTSNGQAIAAVVSIEQLRALDQARSENLADAVRRARAGLDPGDLEGRYSWVRVRDTTVGRDVDLE